MMNKQAHEMVERLVVLPDKIARILKTKEDILTTYQTSDQELSKQLEIVEIYVARQFLRDKDTNIFETHLNTLKEKKQTCSDLESSLLSINEELEDRILEFDEILSTLTENAGYKKHTDKLGAYYTRKIAGHFEMIRAYGILASIDSITDHINSIEKWKKLQQYYPYDSQIVYTSADTRRELNHARKTLNNMIAPKIGILKNAYEHAIVGGSIITGGILFPYAVDTIAEKISHAPYSYDLLTSLILVGYGIAGAIIGSYFSIKYVQKDYANAKINACAHAATNFYYDHSAHTFSGQDAAAKAFPE